MVANARANVIQNQDAWWLTLDGPVDVRCWALDFDAQLSGLGNSVFQDVEPTSTASTELRRNINQHRHRTLKKPLVRFRVFGLKVPSPKCQAPYKRKTKME